MYNYIEVRFMAKHMRIWNKRKFDEYVRVGRGQGESQDYKPWISVQDFSSQGMVTRIYSYKTNRVHHFLSRNELYYFYILEWSDKVLDIREQFPLLDLELAMDIAQKTGIKYPVDNKSKFPYIMTCDFLITTTEGLKARTIKQVKDLQNPRTIEKLEIERRYWKAKGIDWAIVTEEDISIQKAKNIEWFYTAAKLPDEISKRVSWTEMEAIQIADSMASSASIIEEKFGLNPGGGLTLLRHMCWKKMISCDINKSLVPC